MRSGRPALRHYETGTDDTKVVGPRARLQRQRWTSSCSRSRVDAQRELLAPRCASGCRETGRSRSPSPPPARRPGDAWIAGEDERRGLEPRSARSSPSPVRAAARACSCAAPATTPGRWSPRPAAVGFRVVVADHRAAYHRRALPRRARAAPPAPGRRPRRSSASGPETYAVVMTHSLQARPRLGAAACCDRRALRRRARPARAHGDDPGRAGAARPRARLRPRRPRPRRGRARAGGAQHRGRGARGVRPAASRATCASGRWPSMPERGGWRPSCSPPARPRAWAATSCSSTWAGRRWSAGRCGRRSSAGLDQVRGRPRPRGGPRARASSRASPALAVVNPDHAEGAGTSVRTGVRQRCRRTRTRSSSCWPTCRS